MKKITSLLCAIILASTSVFAGGGWATSVVSMTKDGGSAYNYKLNDEGWTDGSWGANTAFNLTDFGTPTTLVLNGGSGNGWTDDSPGYDATSFVIYYRVYKNGDTPGIWSSIVLNNHALNSGNNHIYDESDAGVNILALANVSGLNTYTLEVAMSKNQFYTGGNWNSMVPGGQGTAYSDLTAGYKATFTKSVATGLDQQTKTDVRIIANSGSIDAKFDGVAQVELYTVTGQLIRSASVENQFTQSVKNGAYLLRVNGETHKVVVR